MTPASNDGCARVRARLAVAVDGGLAPLEAALDRGHLEACEGCRHARDEHLRLLERIRSTGTIEVAELERIESAVLARLPAWRSRPQERSRLRPVSWAAVAAALLLVLLAALGRGAPLRSLDTASLARFLDRLPQWSSVVRGLDGLCQRLS